MTCREKLKQEYPELVDECYEGGCSGCPFFYNYRPRGECLRLIDAPKSCRECWDQEVMGE